MSCTVDGCERPRHGTAYCQPHYRRWRKTGVVGSVSPLRVPRWPESAACGVDGCDRPVKSRGYCALHYRRLWETGDPGSARPLKTPNGRACTVPGCQRPNKHRGYCGAHHTRWKRTGDVQAEIPIRDQSLSVPAYSTIHKWIRAERGSASTHRCRDCPNLAVDWSYNHTDPVELADPRGILYSADPAHYSPRCKACHGRVDRLNARKRRSEQSRAVNNDAMVP